MTNTDRIEYQILTMPHKVIDPMLRDLGAELHPTGTKAHLVDLAVGRVVMLSYNLIINQVAERIMHEY